MAQVSRDVRPYPRSHQRQRGQTMILTIAVLLVLFLGFLYVMRRTMIDTVTAGNTLSRQRAVQVTDVVMRNLETAIINAYGSQRLEISGVGQGWWRAVAPGTALPANFWSTCQGAGCASIPVSVNGQNLPFTALVSVQSTGRQPDTYACAGSKDQAAFYYDVNIHIVELSGVTAANTETVLKLCVPTPN